MMDNFELHVVAGETRELEHAIKVVMDEATKLDQWSVDGEWLVFYWSSCAASHPLPVKLDSDGIHLMVTSWLGQRIPLAKEPDIDGSTSYGFELKSERSNSYELFRVRPIWALHGK